MSREKATEDIDDRTPDRNWKGRNQPANALDIPMSLRHLSIGTGYPLATIRGWISKGVSGVKLKTAMMGGRRMTTPRWLREFNAEIARVRDARRSAHDRVIGRLAAPLNPKPDK